MKCFICLISVLFVVEAFSATRTWTGGGTNALWSNTANWSGGVVPSTGDDIVFYNTPSNNTTQNDLPATTVYRSIRLTGVYGTSNDFTINGNTVLLSGGAAAILNDAGTSGSVGAGYALIINADIGFRTAAPTITLLNTTNNGIFLNGNVNNGGMTLTVDNTGNSTNVFISGVVSGSGGFVKDGSGYVMISGTNTFTGTTTLKSGIIRLNNNQALGLGGTVVIEGGGLSAFNTVSLTPHPMTWSGNFSMSGNKDLNLGTGNVTMTDNIVIDVSSRTLTVGGSISGNYSLTKTGAGTLYLSGANTYGKLTTVSAGVLRLGNPAALGAASACAAGSGTVVAAGAVLDLNGQVCTSLESLTLNTTPSGALINTSVTPSSFAGCVKLGSASCINAVIGNITLNNTTTAISGSYNLTLAGNAQGTINNTIATGTGALIKDSIGTWTLTANNTYTGATTINDGTLVVTRSYASPSYTIASGAVLEFNRTANIDYAKATNFSGAGILRKTGSGTIQWNTVVATFAFSSGAVIDIQAGTFLACANNDDIWVNNKADLNIAASATFDCGNQSNVVVDALSGAGALVVGTTAAADRLKIGIDNGSDTFSGIISDKSATYIGRIEKLGTGTQTLSGANSYTGETIITSGELKLGASEVIPNVSAVVVSGILNLNSFSETVGSIAGAGLIDNKTGGGTPIFTFGVNNATTTFAGVMKNTTGTMNVTKTGTGKIYLDGDNTYFGQTYVENGFIEIRNGSIISN